jgi:hypothetical protein
MTKRHERPYGAIISQEMRPHMRLPRRVTRRQRLVGRLLFVGLLLYVAWASCSRVLGF